MAEDPPRGESDDDGEDRFSPGSATEPDEGPTGPPSGRNAEPADPDWVEMPESRLETPAATGNEPVDEDEQDDEDDEYAPEPASASVEPGRPSLENALFVVLGALVMIVVLFRVFSLGFG